MANKKLISASYLATVIRDDPYIHGRAYARMRDHIDNAPAVVRCKDCENICEGTSRPICVSWGSWCDPDGWCYRGERRAEDGK